MTLTTHWFTGWESGNPLQGAVNNTPGALQDLWEWAGSFGSGSLEDADASSTLVRSGRFAYRIAKIGLADSVKFRGHFTPRPGANKWQFWPMGWILEGFAAPANLSNADQYVIARFTDQKTPTDGNKYLGFGFEIVDKDASPITYKPIVFEFNNNDSIAASHAGSVLSVGTTQHFAVVRVDDTSGVTRWFIDGSLDGGSFTAGPTGFTFHEEAISQNSFVGGKGSDAGADLIYDDWASLSNDTLTGQPVETSYGDILYQPTGNEAGLDDFAGSPQAVAKYHNWCNKNRDDASPTDDENTPTAANDYQVSDLADEAGGGGQTVLGVRGIWVCEGGGPFEDALERHTLAARTTGAIKDVALGVQPGNGAWWMGYNMHQTPESTSWGSGATAWAKLNDLDAGVKAEDTTDVQEFYVHAWGKSLTRPSKTPTLTPPMLPALGRRRQYYPRIGAPIASY